MNAQLAMRLARECRIIIQICLREEAWIDAEEEFRWVILAGLNEIVGPQTKLLREEQCSATVRRAHGQ